MNEIGSRYRRGSKVGLAEALLLRELHGPTRRENGTEAAIMELVERVSLLRRPVRYANIGSAARSSIAVSWQPRSGRILASTHGDHTVKLMSKDGNLIGSLIGHERTPWAVAFCPHSPSLVATGDLGGRLRLWSTATGRELASHSLFIAISSIAFHPVQNLLLAAAGDKIFAWSFPPSISAPDAAVANCGDLSFFVEFYSTERPIRAVRFHPLVLKLLLTAEVKPFGKFTPMHESPTASSAGIPWNQAPFCKILEAAQIAYGYVDSSTTSKSDGASFQSPKDRDLLEMDRLSFKHNGSREDALIREAQSVARLYWEADVSMGAHDQHPLQDLTIEVAKILGTLSDVEVAGLQTSYSHLLIKLEALQGMTSVRGRLALCLSLKALGEADTRRAHQNTKNSSRKGGPLLALAEVRVWELDLDATIELLEYCKLRLSVPNCVLFSELGADMSPCGRFLAVCVALEAVEAFELRIISLESDSLGNVVGAKRLEAANCLTTIQFSSSGRHVLLAYGRGAASCRQPSLAMKLAWRNDGSGKLEAHHAMIQVLAVHDLLKCPVASWSSAAEEVNAAVFHPQVGEGVAFATPQGTVGFVS